MPGADEVLVAARSALLDALVALGDHADEITLIGAQAIYLHTGAADVALAETTKDSDLVVDPRALAGHPLLEAAMSSSGFHQNLASPQPGAWLSPSGVPVDLMVPEALAGPGSRRSGRIPPHANHSTRRAVGLEAAVIDRARMPIRALDSSDDREVTTYVAGPAALLVAKLHKLGERREQPSGTVTWRAVEHLVEMFAAGPDAVGSQMAGQAEALIGDPDIVAQSVSILAADLTTAIASP